jgi:hypothetical protein
VIVGMGRGSADESDRRQSPMGRTTFRPTNPRRPSRARTLSTSVAPGPSCTSVSDHCAENDTAVFAGMLGRTVADDVSLLSLPRPCRYAPSDSSRPLLHDRAISVSKRPSTCFAPSDIHSRCIVVFCFPTLPANLRRTYIHHPPSAHWSSQNRSPHLALALSVQSPTPLRDTPLCSRLHGALHRRACWHQRPADPVRPRESARSLSNLSLSALSPWDGTLTSDPPCSDSTLCFLLHTPCYAVGVLPSACS